MPDATYEDARLLVELQDTLTEIRRLKHKLDNLPQQQELVHEQQRLDQVRDRAGAVRLEIQRVQAEVKKHEKDLGLLRHRLTEEQQKLYGGGVTNAREMKSMEAEILAVTTRIDAHETAELEGLEKLDELEAATAELANDEAAQLGEVEAAERRRDESASELIAAIAEAEVSADAQRIVIPRDVLAEYEKVAKRQHLAVAELRDGMCTACGISLPAIEVNELRAGPTLGTCPCPREILMLVDKL